MTGKDFEALFGTDAAAELKAAFEAADAEHEAEVAAEAAKKEAEAAKPQKDGIWYDSDADNENGHKISIYKVVMGGKVVMWARVNTAIVVTADDEPAVAGLPAGVTAHRIELRDAKSTKNLATKGFAVMAPHEDGTHIDGQTVRSFLLPRIPRFLGELYGV